jgi:REP element-mobilizing transposase RayT
VTKYRREAFTKEVIDDLRGIFASICSDFESKLLEFDGEDDHVHLLVNYPPKVAVSALVNSLKGVSSRMIRKKNYPSIRDKPVQPSTYHQNLLRLKWLIALGTLFILDIVPYPVTPSIAFPIIFVRPKWFFQNVQGIYQGD